MRGFMCKIAFDHELEHASGGVRVFQSVEDLHRHHAPVVECGVVEVEVTMVREVIPQNLLGVQRPLRGEE